MRQKSNIILFTVIILGIFLRVYGICQKKSFSHDESVTILDATGSSKMYYSLIESNDFYNKIHPVSKLKPYVSLQNNVTFYSIGKEIDDLSSPLYFWITNKFFTFFGVNYYSGLWINILIFLAYIIALLVLIEALKLSNILKLIVVTLFCFSPAILQFTFEARANGLLGLFVVSYLSVFILKGKEILTNYFKDTILVHIFLSVFALLGLLTNFIFVIYMFAGFVFCISFKFVHKIKIKITNIIYLFFSQLAILLLSLIIYPVQDKIIEFILNPKLSPISDSSFIKEIIAKTKVILFNSSEFLFQNYYLKYVTIFLFLILIMLFVINLKSYFKKNSSNTRYGINFFFFWNITSYLLLIYIGVLPLNSAGEQYFMHIWFFLGVVVVVFINDFLMVKYLRYFSILVLFLVIIQSFLNITSSIYLKPFFDGDYHQIKNCDLLIVQVDSLSKNRGYIPRIIYDLSNDMDVAFIKGIDDLAEIENISKFETFNYLNINKKKTIFYLGKQKTDFKLIDVWGELVPGYKY